MAERIARGQKGTPHARARKPASPRWEKAFLAGLANGGNVREASAAAGVGRSHAYRRRDADPAFRATWSDALEDFADGLEAVAIRRATARVNGSDRLLEFLLKAARPEKYRERAKVRYEVEVHAPHPSELPDEKRLEAMREVRRELDRRIGETEAAMKVVAR